MHFLRVEVGNRVLGAIDHAGLQRLVDLGEGHHLRNTPDRANLILENFRGLNAEFFAFVVSRRLEGNVGREGLEAIVPVGQALDATRFQLGQQGSAHRALGDLVQIGRVIKNEREVKGFELFHAERAKLGERRGQHLYRTHLQGFHFFLVLVQGAVGIDLDLDLALGQLGCLLGKKYRGLAFGRVSGHHVAELDDGLGACAQTDSQQCSGQDGFQFHECLLLLNEKIRSG